MDSAPPFVSVVFLITAFLTAGYFLHLVWKAAPEDRWAHALIVLVPLWMVITAAAAANGFYASGSMNPPRVVLFGVLPAVAFIILIFAFARDSFVARLGLLPLTLIHFIRVPVELVLHWLSDSGSVPVEMTFSGLNFDILSGLTAVPVALIAARPGHTKRGLLLVWNFAALALLLTIVTIAVLSFPTPFQQIGLSQPNRAVMYFPFIWLPAVIVPIVLFCHLASLFKLLKGHYN